MGLRSLGNGALGRFCVKYQALLYFPILFFARISWLIQSALHVLNGQSHPWGDNYTEGPVRNRTVELVTLGLYYVWYIGLLYVPCAGAVPVASLDGCVMIVW